VERPLVPSIPGADAANASISPTGTFVAVTHKAVGQGRYAQIFSVTTGAEVWRSPDGISFTGIGPAWSWSPDGRWLFVTMSADEIIAARTDGLLPDARIKLTTAPLDGIAVTYR
jgi:dipeptidyl aminopeptidase/acylaminoacyl peptidase